MGEQIPARVGMTGSVRRRKEAQMGAASRNMTGGGGGGQSASLPSFLRSSIPPLLRHYEDATRPLGLNTKYAQRKPSSPLLARSSILRLPRSLSSCTRVQHPLLSLSSFCWTLSRTSLAVHYSVHQVSFIERNNDPTHNLQVNERERGQGVT